MRESPRDRERLIHILESIDTIIQYRKNLSFEDFKEDKMRYFGFIKHVEIIGEAVYKLSSEFRETHTEVEWRPIERMRHIMVHGYYTIRPDMVWEIINTDIDELRPLISEYIYEFDSENVNKDAE